MVALLVLHLAVGLAIVAGGARLGRRAVVPAVVAPAATLAWLVANAGAVLGGEPIRESVAWVPALDVDLDLRLDGFAALFVLLVAGIGVLVLAYAGRYLAPDDPGAGRLVGLLVLFAGSMLGLVLADNLVVLFGFWELTSLTSFLLIGNDHTSAAGRAAALQALLITGAGGLALLGGVVLVGQAAGTYSLAAVVAAPPAGTAVTVGLLLVLAGAFAKSAQYPFSSWLPAAMVASTAVSAYLHSATMVTAGVYVVGRLSPAFAGVAGWRPLVVGVGLTSMVAGGLRALRAHDLKLILAQGTISQLGFMIVLLGLGTRAALVAGCALVLAHGVFKAALFMVAGIVDHQAGTRDVRRLRPWGPGWRPALAVGLVAAASMAGVPLTYGFVAKEEDFGALADSTLAGAALVLALVVAASVLTAGYSLRVAAGLLGWLREDDAADPATRPGPAAAPAPSGWFVAPAAVLAAVTLALGVFPAWSDRWAGGAARALDPNVGSVHLALWHGPNLPFLLSAVALGGGVALYVGRRAVDRALALGARVPDGGAVYRCGLRALDRGADRVTAVVQSGSLPVYAGVILSAAAVLTTGALVARSGWWPGWPDAASSPRQVVVCVAVLTTAVAAGVVRRRFSAALLLGAAGYAMAALFVVQGGADLALTQVAIETLTTVLFVLVLRRLPDRFESRAPLRGRAVRIGIAAAVGATVFALALTASGDGGGHAVSDEMIERAVPDGHGRDVVNVILVDFRGLDTLGEITVLTAAAIGAVALARAGRRPGRRGPGARPAAPPRAAGRESMPRLVVVDVAVRVVVPAVMVGSIYLLFAGHNQPGGGFAGGIVAGAAVALRYVAGGIDDVRRVSRARPWTVLGGGLALATVTALGPVVGGGSVLESYHRTVDVPLIGSVALNSALLFDIGVYLVVLGLVLMVFESFGDEPQAAA